MKIKLEPVPNFPILKGSNYYVRLLQSNETRSFAILNKPVHALPNCFLQRGKLETGEKGPEFLIVGRFLVLSIRILRIRFDGPDVLKVGCNHLCYCFDGHFVLLIHCNLKGIVKLMTIQT